MIKCPVIRQLMVAVSCLLAAMSVGSSIAFPSVVLKQLASNESTIHLDLDTTSWVGSIHGLAGIPSIIMPALMQWRGRKIMYIAACLISAIGWIIGSTATSAATILISECFHGFGSNSLLVVALLTMGEMLSPQFRNVSMPLYLVSEVLGAVLVQTLGCYLHWKTVCIIMGIPITLAALIACTWTESPSWLAYKGKFDLCEKNFIRLRGTSNLAKKELKDLIAAQKELFLHDIANKQPALNYFCHKLKCRDFYLPCLHIFVLLFSIYWSGGTVIYIYGADIFHRITKRKDTGSGGSILFNYVLLASCPINIFSTYFSPKVVSLITFIFNVLSLLSASLVNYLQTIGLISSDSPLSFYFLVMYIFSMSVSSPSLITLSSELLPVKHRGVGGPLYIVFACVLQASSLKLAPYLFLYINVWGTVLLYAVNAILGSVFIWKYIPNTKGRTLQEIEDYYAYGNFDKRHNIPDEQTCMTELMPKKI